MTVKGSNGKLTGDDLDVANERATEVHHVGRRRSQRTGFEPEHIIYSMVLPTNVRSALSHAKERLSSLSAETRP